MPSDTINDTTWAGINAPPRKISLRVAPCSVASPRVVFLAAELALIGAAVLVVMWTGKSFEVPILIALCAVAFHVKALDRSIIQFNAAGFWRDFGQALCWGTCAGVLVLNAFPSPRLRTDAYFAGLLLAGLLPVVLRPVLRHLIDDERLVEGMLIVGSGELAAKLHEALAARGSPSRPHGTSALLRFPEFPTEAGDTTDFSRLPDILRRDRISRVIVAEQNAQNRARLASTLVAPRLRGLLVNDAVDFCEQFFGKIWIDALSSEWFVYTSGFDQSKVSIFLKRCFDIFFALLLLILAAPLLLLVAMAVDLDSAGPILFRQVRVGLHGKTFMIYKFRSMRQDGAFPAAPAWAKERDERVTRIGRLLRRFRLDEIPQAFNVLRGEMSLVGPRPEQPYFVDRLAQEIPFYNLRHFVKPGITGWAQVKYRYGASVEDACEKLQYDLYYAKHRSCAFDVEILFKTVKIVARGLGL
jgi:exopolysaccharide biosynthesis polyprenyl glycosylphosphotransferase